MRAAHNIGVYLHTKSDKQANKQSRKQGQVCASAIINKQIKGQANENSFNQADKNVRTHDKMQKYKSAKA
jgi:hypothetical protein